MKKFLEHSEIIDGKYKITEEDDDGKIIVTTQTTTSPFYFWISQYIPNATGGWDLEFEKDINKNGFITSMSNEILVKNNISLKKYLREIKIVKVMGDKNPKILENIMNIIKNNTPT